MKMFVRVTDILYYAVLATPWISLLILWGLYFAAAIMTGYFPRYEHPEPTVVFGEAHLPLADVAMVSFLISSIIPILFLLQCILQPFRWQSMVISFIGFLFNLFTMFFVGFWLFD